MSLKGERGLLGKFRTEQVWAVVTHILSLLACGHHPLTYVIPAAFPLCVKRAPMALGNVEILGGEGQSRCSEEELCMCRHTPTYGYVHT